MQCYNHLDNEAVATCKNCGKAICNACAVDVSGVIYCQDCLASQTTSTRQATKTNTLSIVSLICGLLGLAGCLCGGAIGGILFGIPAVITGWLARKQLIEDRLEQQGSQLAMAGMILGSIEVVLGVLGLVLFGAAFGLGILQELL